MHAVQYGCDTQPQTFAGDGIQMGRTNGRHSGTQSPSSLLVAGDHAGQETGGVVSEERSPRRPVVSDRLAKKVEVHSAWVPINRMQQSPR